MTKTLTAWGSVATLLTCLQAPETDRRFRCGTGFWPLLDHSDEALLDFETTVSAADDVEHARVLLGEQHDIFGNHLAIAKFIDGWILRLTEDARPSEFNDGYTAALIDICNHLRDGDLLDPPEPAV